MFGMSERESGKCFFQIVESRDRENLLPIIYKHCQKDTVIFSDKWSSYNDIARLNSKFKHYTVNHSLHFVEPVKVQIGDASVKVHTNGIESDWNACKSRFKSMRGTI